MSSKKCLVASLSLIFFTASFLSLNVTASPAQSVSFSAATIVPGPVETGPSANEGDFNQDELLDMALPDFEEELTSRVFILLGTASGGFDAAPDVSVLCPKSVAVGDFNGDDKLDLAVASCEAAPQDIQEGNVAILLGNGDGTFGTASHFAVGRTPLSVAVGDFNRDEKLDLAVTNGVSDDVSILLGNGDGTFEPAKNFTAGRSPYSVAVGDLNGDGKLDLAVANLVSNDISVLLGTGTGYFGPTKNFPVPENPVSVAVVDFNGDGKLDLVVNQDSDNVSVLLNTSPPARLAIDAFLPEGEAGIAYNHDLHIGGGDPPYEVSVIKGFLPPGLSLLSSNIVGTPTVAGSTRFTIQVIDQLGTVVTRTLKVKIVKAVTVTTTNLKSGGVGKKYNASVKATGGRKPFTWSLISGTLPVGLAFNPDTAKITGIPIAAGSTDLTFRVTDSLGGSSERTLTLTIN